MKTIVTITLNPALDKSAKIDRLVPDRKLRASNITHEPGGGGINVSRALKKLGCTSYAIYTKGGHVGEYFHDLLEEEGVEQRPVEIKDIMRENILVVEESTDRHYRFGMKGARLTEKEAQQCIDALTNFDPKPEIIVASGSLSPGLPSDFFGELASIANNLGAKFILDTSGAALKEGVKNGVFLLKPNLGELSSLAGVEYVEMDMVEKLAKELIDQGKTEVVAVSLGGGGALLVTKDITEHVPTPTVHKKSVVGAGDSMVAGMAFSLAQGKSLREMIRHGVAAGTAATMTPGSELCRKKDVENLYKWIIKNSPV
jgi:6-phosphofructokinase 2